VIGVITGIFLLGELPNLWGLAGIGLIIYGSYYVLDTTEAKFSWALLRQKEIKYRILAMILTAIEAVFVKKVILASSTLISFFSWCWFGALFSFAFLFLSKINWDKSKQHLPFTHILRLFYLISCMGTMQLTTNYVFDHMPVGYALSLFQLSVLVSVILGYKVFQEKSIFKKLIGSIIMIAGSVLIILFKNR
jgi:drug/metabolite transporter (DMT)-like permease